MVFHGTRGLHWSLYRHLEIYRLNDKLRDAGDGNKSYGTSEVAGKILRHVDLDLASGNEYLGIVYNIFPTINVAPFNCHHLLLLRYCCDDKELC